jgi:hypothetical protein
MDTWKKENYTWKRSVELRCDSSRCWKCSGDVCEERFEDLVFGVGP